MRASLADKLRCPRCHTARPFTVRETASDAREIRTGSLTCTSCGFEAPIQDGFVDLMHDPPEFVVREAAGLERFAEFMRNDGWDRERVVALPEGGDGYWWAQAVMMGQVLASGELQPGESIIDLGSNTCWATAEFAKHGLDAVALDIAVHEMQGLRTADWQFEDKGVFFERTLAMMFDLPFADGSFDHIWACEVLHHNHRENLARTLRECYRVLRPGGSLIVVNEPLRNLAEPRLDPGHEVAEFEGHEHAYMRFSYTGLAKRAGFDVEVRGPWIHGTYRPGGIGIDDRMGDLAILRAAGGLIARRHRWLQRAMLASRAYIRGKSSLHMVCTKPG